MIFMSCILSVFSRFKEAHNNCIVLCKSMNETERINTAIIKCVIYKSRKYMYLKQALLVHVAKYLLEGQTKNEEISVVIHTDE